MCMVYGLGEQVHGVWSEQVHGLGEQVHGVWYEHVHGAWPR